MQLIFDWYRGMVEPATGSLAYLYDPELERVVVDGSLIRDIAAIWDIEVLGDFLGRDELQRVTTRALDRFQALVVTSSRGSVVTPSDEPATIGHNAVLILALARSHRADRAERALPLAEAILRQQRRDGSYQATFDAGVEGGAEDLSPAEAMLALLESFGLTGDARFLDSVERSFRYYRLSYFDRGRVAPETLVFFANWQSQAGRMLCESTTRAETRRFVATYLCELHDRIAEAGFYDDLARFPFAQACVEVACALEGVSDAFAVAALVNSDRADAFRSYAQRALSLLIAAQRTVGCTPRERGGFGYSLEDRTQRVDVTGHAASGFIKCLENGIVRPERPVGLVTGGEQPWHGTT
ncbi:MAG: hypothetical protein QM765_33655 [Myxococcales bacterium]